MSRVSRDSGAVRRVGVEEELYVVDPGRARAVPAGPRVLAALAGDDEEGEAAPEAELVRTMVEVQTDPVADLGELADAVRRSRAVVGRAAERVGLAIAATATAPVADEVQVSDKARYHAMQHHYATLAAEGGTCGLHVHVDVASDEEGVAVLDRIAPWLPLVLAVSANSPFSAGRDTGYASWRLQQWGRFPTAGPTDPFGSVEGYQRAADALVAAGAALDRGMLYFDARLSERYPTVEVRIADVPTDPDDTVLVAALCRALVSRAARDAVDGGRAPGWRSEMLRAARWRASRFGLTRELLHPVTAEAVGAADALGALVEHVADDLAVAGDHDLVDTGVRRVLVGTGATRQRAAYERDGSVEAVVRDLVERTRASWA